MMRGFAIVVKDTGYTVIVCGARRATKMLQSENNPQRIEYSFVHYVMFWNWVRRNFKRRGVVFRGAWAK